MNRINAKRNINILPFATTFWMKKRGLYPFSIIINVKWEPRKMALKRKETEKYENENEIKITIQTQTQLSQRFTKIVWNNDQEFILSTFSVFSIVSANFSFIFLFLVIVVWHFVCLGCMVNEQWIGYNNFTIWSELVWIWNVKTFFVHFCCC